MTRNRISVFFAAALSNVLVAGACASDSAVDATGASSPLVGTWTEVTPTACQQAAHDTAAVALGELKFAADGTFQVTWVPFETYVDYWGIYRHDPASGALVMGATSGNHLRADMRLKGTARIDPDGKLQIAGVFFGTPMDRGGEPGTHKPSDCPLVFKLLHR